MDLVKAAVTCISKVDFPIPGSPPTKIADPGTNPPPVTRSNSLIFEILRGGRSVVPLRPTNSTLRPLPLLKPLGADSLDCSSTNEFHSPHPSHRPVHFEWLAPQV